MKNKTIFDAVNEFKGEVLDVDVKGIVFRPLTGELKLWYSHNLDNLNTPTWVHLCSIEEFNALVEEMETNFGECRPINVSDYKIVTKTPLKPVEPVIDWKDAPDGMSKFGRVGNNGGEVFYNSEGYFYKESGRYFPFDKENECTFDFDKVSLVATRPTQSSTYTQEEQAIKDACDIVDDSKRCKDTNINIDCSAAQKAVIITLIKNGYIKPPVPLIDGKAYQFDMFNGNIEKTGVSGIYSSEDDEFIYLQNVVRPFDCTNIQPLTVEGK